MGISDSFRGLLAPPRDEKALSPHASNEVEPLIFSQAQQTRISIRKAFDHLSAYAGDEAIDWVYDCVTLISEAIAGADYHFERDGERLVNQRVSSDPSDVTEAPKDLVELLRRPNPYATWKDLITLLVIDWLLIGNGFWLRFKANEEGKPRSLYRLMPQYLELIPGKRNLVDAYEYRVPGKGVIRFAPEDVIQFKRPNPHSEYLGAGVIKGGARIFDMEIALTRSQTEYFEQGTRLSGVLESDRGVPPSTWRKIKGQFSALYAGAANSYKVAMLTHGMKFKPIQANAAEAEFGKLGDKSRDRILAMFRTPAALLGLLGGSDRQAVKEAQRIFDNKTVRPIADALQDVISLALTQSWGVDFKIDYEYVLPIEDKLALAVDFATLPGVKVLEVRAAVDLDPLGDERDQIVLNLPGEDDNASKVKDRGLGSEPGRPPNPENTAAFPKPGEAPPADATVQRQPQQAQARRAQKAFTDAADRLEHIAERLVKA